MSTQRSIALGALTVALALAIILLGGPFIAGSLGRATPASAGPLPGAPLQVTTADTRSTLVVAGVGTASGTPDVAHIDVGVESRAQTAQAAADATNKKQAAVIAALKAKGIDAKDLQTASYNLFVEHANNDQNTVTGYRASTVVNVTVRQIDQVGAILDAAVGAGANQINSISFGLSDSEPLLAQARNAAILNARAKADAMAKSAGIKLGKILNLSESFAGGPVPFAVDARASSAAPIEAGQTTVRAQVSIMFAIE